MSYAGLSVLEFQRRFSTEAACQEALERARWPQGFVCPRRGHGRATRIATRGLLRCAACHHQASLTAGTILHKTRTPLMKWFWAMWRVAQDKGGTSAKCLARQLELDYRTAWSMLHKLRKALAQRGAPHGNGLGRYRWVVERTLSWLHQNRRLRVRYDKRGDIHEAFMTLGCALICAKRLGSKFR